MLVEVEPGDVTSRESSDLPSRTSNATTDIRNTHCRAYIKCLCKAMFMTSKRHSISLWASWIPTKMPRVTPSLEVYVRGGVVKTVSPSKPCSAYRKVLFPYAFTCSAYCDLRKARASPSSLVAWFSASCHRAEYLLSGMISRESRSQLVGRCFSIYPSLFMSKHPVLFQGRVMY